MEEVRVIQLQSGHLQDVVQRVQKGTRIQFRPSPSLFGEELLLLTNYPPSPSTPFQRDTYYPLQWNEFKSPEDAFANLTALVAGTFQYRFQRNGKEGGSGYFLVDPVLEVGKAGSRSPLPLDSIMCQTFFPKSLGPFPQWKGRLAVAHHSGYNMIHFTPVQELGASNSSYSISDQLKLNPLFGPGVSFGDLGALVREMEEDWGVLSISDVVFNHTANETPWLLTNPEVGYNLQNSAHLRPAYLLDALLVRFGVEVWEGKWAERGIPPSINTEDHLNIIRVILQNELLPKAKIEEMFLLHVDELAGEFEKVIESGKVGRAEGTLGEFKIIQDPDYRRLKSRVDLNLAVQIHFWQKHNGENKAGAVNSFRQHLVYLNDQRSAEIWNHLFCAVENAIAGIRYERVQADGPKLPKVDKANPLVHAYFQKIGLPPTGPLEEEEAIVFSDKCRFILAHNGWVMNDDPLRNFAEKGSNVYLRRELLAWGDSVKLRFGNSPEDCPFLWDLMRKYAELTAKIFHGLRLDNCHSTPINVAEYLLDAARKVRPDLYVVAELFTNSDKTDNVFVNRLGITSLIREAMSAHDSHEEGRLVYRYGGLPVGCFGQEPVRPLLPSIAHALMMDQTHDNPSPIQKRSVYDILPTAGLVAMAGCATGSNRGLDELVPHHIHVVTESRLYSSWSEAPSSGTVNYSTGILSGKKALNDLHAWLGKSGFAEVFVDQMDYDIVAVTRHHPVSHERIVLVAYTAFSTPSLHFRREPGSIKDLVFEGTLAEVLFECRLKPKDLSKGNFPPPSEFVEDPNFINSLTSYECSVQKNFPISSSQFVRLEGSAIKFLDFQPGSVIAFRILPPPSLTAAVGSIRTLISKQKLSEVTGKLSLLDLNYVLFRCEEEEQDFSGTGCYTIPNYGALVYAGLQGIESVMSQVRLLNDTGHPICNNLRAGDWLLEYSYKRLLNYGPTRELGNLLQEVQKHMREIPRYLIPTYFDLLLKSVYLSCLESAWNQMSPFVKEGSPLTKALALGSVQCCGLSVSGPLPFLSPNMVEPRPPVLDLKGQKVQGCGSLCAGLTHFSTGYMRNWGRDTFISLPGLLIRTGRHHYARNHILAYASVLRHGLIPNLLDKGTNSRFNCRDATWFWLYAIQQYVENVPNGEAILKDKVARMWPDDFGEPVLNHSVEQSLEEVMQESLQRHFQGISFRERNAGSRIDAHMSDPGFQVVAGIDYETGFVFGGNAWNCGTWMDKMGSSEKAGNRGVPATPRDGSAVELVGLSASVVLFLENLHSQGKYRFNSVSSDKGMSWTFAQWGQRIKDNFEKHFWVPVDAGEKLVNRRGIYKDTFRATAAFADYQLRPNFLVAMVVAPHLFSPERARKALDIAGQVLLPEKGIGLRTLDPSDWNYNGNYDNSNDSCDPKLAHGFNYHNGPEWVWPVGFYLRALLKFYSPEKVGEVRKILGRHWQQLQASPWKGLVELTNKDGAECWGSCKVQAWSMATLLEVMRDLDELSPGVGA